MTNVFGSITMGSDPEIFVTNINGTPFGAKHSGITGTKEEPQRVPFGAIQVDGMALEFNIDPASTVKEWVHNHNAVMKHITNVALEHNLHPNFESMLDFTKYIDTMNPTEDETLFGCEPDYSADTMQENVMPENDGTIKFRTTGGHVHIGMSNWADICEVDGHNFTHAMAQRVVFVCDYVLGVWSVLHDNGIERKKLYGKAGAYRIKPYGVEYRTLSNFWIFNDEHMKYIFNTMTLILNDYELFNELYLKAKENRGAIVHCINTNHKKLAETIFNSIAL